MSKNPRVNDLPLGVYPAATGVKFIAAMRHNGVRHYLGCFDTVAEASAKVARFREENPKREYKKPWQPGDEV